MRRASSGCSTNTAPPTSTPMARLRDARRIAWMHDASTSSRLSQLTDSPTTANQWLRTVPTSSCQVEPDRRGERPGDVGAHPQRTRMAVGPDPPEDDRGGQEE